jgi:hypothetical protein
MFFALHLFFACLPTERCYWSREPSVEKREEKKRNERRKVLEPLNRFRYECGNRLLSAVKGVGSCGWNKIAG